MVRLRSAASLRARLPSGDVFAGQLDLPAGGHVERADAVQEACSCRRPTGPTMATTLPSSMSRSMPRSTSRLAPHVVERLVNVSDDDQRAQD